MATLTVQTIVRAGLNPSYASADVAGDEFANTGNEFIHVKNADSSAHTVTVETSATVDGLAVVDRQIVIPAAGERMIGPFPASTYNDSSNLVQLTYSAVTGVTVAVLTAV